MNWITAILLFVGFFALEYMAVKGLHSVLENKVLLSGFYSFASWIIYLFGVYEFINSTYYTVPIIIGSVFGTMVAVYLKRRKKEKEEPKI